jgi:hypothetical protein
MLFSGYPSFYHAANGKYNRKVVPNSGWLSASIRPLWDKTILCTMARPNPSLSPSS